jgi:outer membrane biosynthesis protein TonB
VSFAQWASQAVNPEAVSPSRSLAEIQQTFDKNKRPFFNLFHSYARKERVGAGKIEVSITIAPDGTVTDCHIVSTAYDSHSLNEAVVAEVKKLNFGARNVPEFTYSRYPINVLPFVALEDEKPAQSPEQWAARIAGKVRKSWRRPVGSPDDFRCMIRIEQTPDGVTTLATVAQSCGTADLDRSIEDAVMAANPLPLADLSIFDPVIQFTFCSSYKACQ